MCGIAGWIDFKATLDSQSYIVKNMCNTLLPRGPDAEGLWMSHKAILGHRRLAVVDLTSGAQPMIRKKGESNCIITYNGELYNTIDLQNQLISMGHRFYSTSDTEVLLMSYIEWGIDCVNHLNGIFAFAIWDEKENRIFIARDRFGVKPLFYAIRDDSLIFASELKAMLAHPFISPVLDEEGLMEVFSLSPARTPGSGVFKDIYEVKPAHYLIYSPNSLVNKSYWQLVSRPHEDSFEVTTEKVRNLVVDSIQRQLVADVPVCTFLSGGLDSSAITALAANYFKNEDTLLHTFSIDYKDNNLNFTPNSYQPDPDEKFINLMSESFKTEHHRIEFDTPKLVDALYDATLARDLPGMADIDSSLWLFCKEIKKSHVVGLSGECADEVFGGYPWFYRSELMDTGNFPWVRHQEERFKVLSKDLKGTVDLQNYTISKYLETINKTPALQGEDPLDARRREIFYLNINWFMTTLLDRKDRMSMASGLEVRVPFCDHRLVEYVWNIPWNLKYYNGMEKGILRKALEGILPNDILYRKKSPFPKTHNPSYEGAVKEILKDIISDGNSPLIPFVDRKELLAMMKGTSDYGKPWFGQLMAVPQLYAYLIQVNFWLEKYKVSVF